MEIMEREREVNWSSLWKQRHMLVVAQLEHKNRHSTKQADIEVNAAIYYIILYNHQSGTLVQFNYNIRAFGIRLHHL